MSDYLQLPLKAAKHDLGTVFDATGEEFCVSHGMQDEVSARAAYIALAGTLFWDLVAVCEQLDEAADYPAICEARQMARDVLEQVRAVPSAPLALADVKEGDIVVRWHYSKPSDHLGYAKVTRTTRTQIIIGEDRFSRASGQMVGGWFTSDKIKPCSEELNQQIGERLRVEMEL